MIRPAGVGALILVGFSVFGTALPARAGSTATRCDANGCIHIHCNATGDRCYRYSDEHGNSLIGRTRSCKDCRLPRRDLQPRDSAGLQFSMCDTDGNRCYLTNGRHWDFREYYRSLGYRWNDEAP